MDWIVKFYEATKNDFKSNTFSFSYLVIAFIILAIFFTSKLVLKYRSEVNKNKIKDKAIKKEIFENLILAYFCELFLASGVSFIFIVLFNGNGVIVGPTIGVFLSPYLESKLIKNDIVNQTLTTDKFKLFGKSSKDKEEKNEEFDNNLGFFNPTIDKDEINIEHLDITSILEVYGYISPNQKYKMISSSIFETPGEQVHKLLSMAALEKSELKEATVILNLIRLKKRLVSKEEALKYIMEQEDNNKGGL